MVPRLRARGLVNTGSICFVNAVLQLLVHSPPFWDLFRELGGLKGPRGEGIPETSDGATPLVDATLRLFEEFRFKEKEHSPPQEPPLLVAGGKLTEDEETKEFNSKNSLKPTYMHNAMKQKKQLKNLLVRSRTT
jgi:ubiquitin carboxyl-terminal hydrolase 10